MAKQKTENEEYKRLLEKHEALDDLTDEALDTRREWFIQEVISHYDMVEIGTLYFGIWLSTWRASTMTKRSIA